MTIFLILINPKNTQKLCVVDKITQNFNSIFNDLRFHDPCIPKIN